MKIRTLIISAIACLQACTTIDPRNSELSEFSSELRYGFYTNNNQRISNYQYESGLTLIFPSIPGAIFGSPADDILHVAKVTNNYTFKLSLPSKIDDKARAINESDLKVLPSHTKLLRLGTFHLFPSYENGIGGGGFIDAESGTFLILVYFSNPAEVSGVLTIGQDQYIHQINVPSSGWNWIAITELSPNKYRLSEFNGKKENIEFSVIIEDILSI